MPQIIFNSVKEFEYLTNRVEEIGYKQIDLNMGCPFPLQAKHKRGSGILQHPGIVEEIIDKIKQYPDIEFSVKMRLGWENEEEIEQIMPILNKVDFQHITIAKNRPTRHQPQIEPHSCK